MTVSILTPVYGVERYIERCAVSLFEQTYNDLEFVFVDDCSTDASISILRSVIERYPGRKAQTRIIRNDRNRGLGYSRAEAVRQATGEFIMHVDSDDRIPTDAVEQLVRRQRETEADMVDGAYRRESSDGLSAPITPPPADDKRRLLRLMLCQDLAPSNIWARLIRRSLYTDYGINNIEGIDYAEDYSVTPRLMLHASRAATDSVVYLYNVENTSSYSHSMTLKHVASMARANAVVYEYFTSTAATTPYRAAAEVGLLNMLRNVRRAGFALAEADRYCPYHTTGIACRTVELLLRSKAPFFIANAAFLLLRRITAMRA